MLGFRIRPRGAAWLALFLSTLVIHAGCDEFLEGPLGSSIVRGLGGLLGTSEDSNSCGTDQLAALIPDCPADLVCFTAACDSHNQCYADCDHPKVICDARFFEEMLQICTRSFSEGDPRLARCQRLSFSYWRAVDQFGQDAFDSTCPFREVLPVQLGACCLSEFPVGCTDRITRQKCNDGHGVFFSGLDCANIVSTFDGCPTPPNDTCDDAEVHCSNQAPDADLGRCDESENSQAGGGVCSVSAQDCPNEMPCRPYEADAFRCRIATDTRLATTDGDGGLESCGVSHQADVWYHYVAPCSGTLTIQMCGEPNYDAVMAVYGNKTPDGDCICPSSGSDNFLDCDDDSCGLLGTVSAITIQDTVVGACYTIAVGGWSPDDTEEKADRGVSELSIGMFCDPRMDTSGADDVAGG